MDRQRGGDDPICIESVTGYHDAVERFKRDLLTRTLQAHAGNRTYAARALGLQRTYLIRLIRDLGISVPIPDRWRHEDINGE